MIVYDLKIGEKGFINSIDGDIKLFKRLFVFGCINSIEIEVKKVVLFGDLIIIRFRGFDFVIRKFDVKNIFL